VGLEYLHVLLTKSISRLEEMFLLRNIDLVDFSFREIKLEDGDMFFVV
jgi:hypothetical protein